MSRRANAVSAARNRQPILDVLARILPAHGLILEIASGTGQHAGYFAPRLAPRRWQPSDIDRDMFDSITAWTEAAPGEVSGGADILPPIVLDATADAWPVERADAIVCINMIHIAPFEACAGLLAGAGRILPQEGPLYFYGPFKRCGAHTAPTNQQFDDWLQVQDARWGVRDLDLIAEEAAGHGLVLDEVVEMPANNLSVIFRKRKSD